VQGKVGISAAEASGEVVFECADCAFGHIALMDVGWHQLVVNVLVSEECFKSCQSLIVQTLEAWLQFSTTEVCMQALECIVVASVAILKWFD